MEEILKSLASGGIPGTILAFILWKIAPALKDFRDFMCEGLRKLEEAQDRSTRKDILRLIARADVSDEIKQFAAEQITELDAAEEDRKRRARTPAPVKPA